MDFTGTVKSVRSNIGDGTITLTFEIPYEQRDEAEDLSQYAGSKEASNMQIKVTPVQPPLFKDKKARSK